MKREEVVDVMNKCFTSRELDINEYLPLLSEFLTLEYPNKADKIVQLVISQPLLVTHTIDIVKDYFIKKYNILYVSKMVNNRLNLICYLK